MVRPVGPSNQDNFNPLYAEGVSNVVNQSHQAVKESQDLVKKARDTLREQNKVIKEAQNLVEKACDILDDQSNEYDRIGEKLDEGIKLGKESIALMDKKIEELNEMKAERIQTYEALDQLRKTYEEIEQDRGRGMSIENIKKLIEQEDHSVNVDASNKETSILGRCCEIVSSVVEAFLNCVRCVYRALVGE